MEHKANVNYTTYLNVRTFLLEWRKYTPVNSNSGVASKSGGARVKNTKKYVEMAESEFNAYMQANQYVETEVFDAANGRRVIVYIFDQNSEYVLSSQKMSTLVAQEMKTLHNALIMLITYTPLSSYHTRLFARNSSLNIVVYPQYIFALISPKGPLVYPHRVLSREEVHTLMNKHIMCKLQNLPKIRVNDPQCIWIGAEVGDVVEITSVSDTIGLAISYRVVIPIDGQVFKVSAEINDVAETVEVADADDADADAAADNDDEVTEYKKDMNEAQEESDEE